MKAVKIIDNSEILTSTVLVMCCLGHIHWCWFWICFGLSEVTAMIWYNKKD